MKELEYADNAKKLGGEITSAVYGVRYASVTYPRRRGSKKKIVHLVSGLK